MKAVKDPAEVYEHLERYPGIEVMVTEEVAALVPEASSTGISNEDIDAQVLEVLQETRAPGLAPELVDAASTSLLVGAALAAGKAIHEGRVVEHELKAAMGDLGVGLTTAFVLDTLLTGG